MSTPTKSEYMLLFRGTDWHKGLSPEKIQQVVNQMKAWFDRLTAEGKAKAGKPLFHEGKIVSQKGGRSVTDGPFAESKEAIGGFFLLEVESLDEAAEIAEDFPIFAIRCYGQGLAPVAPECMIGETAQQRNAREARLRASA